MKKLIALTSGIGMLLLILDTKTALKGAIEGIELCLRSVIPSLLPFFVLSNLLLGAMDPKSGKSLRKIAGSVGIPAGEEVLLIVAFLGGYPVGAQAAAQLYRDGKISGITAQRLTAFCSNAGPSFIFGIVAGEFTAKEIPWALWLIQILSALSVAVCLPAVKNTQTGQRTKSSVNLSAALNQSIRALVSVCSWVMLFRVILAYLHGLMRSAPNWIRVTLTGVLELTNGCCMLNSVANEKIRFVIAAAILSFGGFCIILQTASVIQPLKIHMYLKGKALQCVIAVLYAWISITFSPLIPPVAVCSAIILRNMKKRSGNLQKVGV